MTDILFSFLTLTLHLCHQPQPVATPNLLNVALAKLPSHKMNGEVDEFRGIGQTSYTTVAVEIGS